MFVATSTRLDPEWANASAIDGDLVDFVRDLKNWPGGDIGVHASISVAQTLLAAHVVDELKLVVAPAIASAGRKLGRTHLECLPGGHFLVERGALTSPLQNDG
ncbi:hypothetical protein GCM10022381_06040 [Leifsonia kafniensis]|uniref:Bacterial bifunctional deaminase-reductase C-terminal domain-containing protein n=1 Tax=Leifsonia kafniensis TaxID=475957 RepID=A0ABP7K495_9MICO